MQLQIGPHLDESEVEQYSMDQLPEASLAHFEEHLLACESCQDRLLEMETYVNAVRSVSPRLRQANRPWWRERYFGQRPTWVAAFAVGVAWGGSGWLHRAGARISPQFFCMQA